jgi:hypothetical protein
MKPVVIFRSSTRDGVRESISRLGVKIDNGLEKPK